MKKVLPIVLAFLALPAFAHSVGMYAIMGEAGISSALVGDISFTPDFHLLMGANPVDNAFLAGIGFTDTDTLQTISANINVDLLSVIDYTEEEISWSIFAPVYVTFKTGNLEAGMGYAWGIEGWNQGFFACVKINF